MSDQERNNKKNMICLTPKPDQKISEIIGLSLWPSSSRGLNPLYYSVWCGLENKTNATSHQNIGSLNTAIENE